MQLARVNPVNVLPRDFTNCSKAVAGAGLAFAVKRLVADQVGHGSSWDHGSAWSNLPRILVQAGAQADRTSEYYDCPLRLLGSADDDALLQ